MNKTSKQLETVFQEVTDYFAAIPDITVTPGDGNPPEEYTITYHRTGVCKEGDAAVSSCDTHIISIALPFGFPHFPPNCIPKSSTFHPDFDSSAICIGDAWETDQSIVNLILHIGQMISGEIYSETSAFNEEAAGWYKANRDTLPFAKPGSEQEAAATIPETISEENDSDTIDTLDDADFGQSLSIERESEFDEDLLQHLASRKRFQALSQELRKIDEQFDGRSDLEDQAQSALDEAAELFREAEKEEHQGRQQEALDKLQAVEERVSDYPNLQKAQERVQMALDLLGDGIIGIQPDSDDPDSEESADAQASERTFFEDQKKPAGKGMYFVLGGGVIALTIALTVFYIFLGSGMKKAAKSFAECQSLLNGENFKGAEQTCRKALEFVDEVRIVKQGDKKQLTAKIQTLLNSPKLRQGLAGKTLFNGKYVFQAFKEQFQLFTEAKKNGDALLAQEHWYEASLSYGKALKIAEEIEIEEKFLTEIRDTQPQIQFKGVMGEGEKALSRSDWDNALVHFSKALELARTNLQSPPEQISQIELLLKQAEFNAVRTQSNELFKKDEWEKALNSYQRAIALAHELNLAESDTISGLQRNMARTQIYIAIKKGREAFASAQWDTAIAQYEKAGELLEENAKLLGETKTQENREKVARVTLHAAIIRDKQNVARHLKSDEYDPAVKQLQKTGGTIAASQFATTPEFEEILKEIASQIDDIKGQSLIARQTAYLTENYEELFIKHYPAAARSKLSKPKVEYLKNINSKLLFRMQCTETAGGRPLRLQMDYLYSPASNSWQFYSEE